MMEVVHRYEGTVNQVMGDEIMALFGAPLAHEDHAVDSASEIDARRKDEHAGDGPTVVRTEVGSITGQEMRGPGGHRRQEDHLVAWRQHQPLREDSDEGAYRSPGGVCFNLRADDVRASGASRKRSGRGTHEGKGLRLATCENRAKSPSSVRISCTPCSSASATR